MATRSASGKTLAALADVLPELWGGSADLGGSNNTTMPGQPSALPVDRQTATWSGHPYGRTLHFGVREHAMGAIANGIALEGHTRPYVGTFLVFSDYMRPSVRMAALMGLPPSTSGATTRSGSVRTAPRTSRSSTSPHSGPSRACRWSGPPTPTRPSPPGQRHWSTANGPVALALTRQNVPVLAGTAELAAEGTARGGYVLADHAEPGGHAGRPVSIATGSEVQLAVEAADSLRAEGYNCPRRLDALPGVVRPSSRRSTERPSCPRRFARASPSRRARRSRGGGSSATAAASSASTTTGHRPTRQRSSRSSASPPRRSRRQPASPAEPPSDAEAV